MLQVCMNSLCFCVHTSLCVFAFVSAAVAFKNAKQLEEAKEAYLQEAEAHTNNKTYPYSLTLCEVIM